jgi:hypothetical protein
METIDLLDLGSADLIDGTESDQPPDTFYQRRKYKTGAPSSQAGSASPWARFKRIEGVLLFS